MSNLHAPDLLFIAVYFIILFGIAWWAALREKNVSSDYFLASRGVAWFAVGASLFASNIGSEHLVGLAGTGAGSGLAVGHFEWLACFMLLRSEEHTSELQSPCNLVCRLLLEKKKKKE